jgi:hypothetical protein
MFSRLFNFFHRILPFLGRLHFCRCHSHNLDSCEIGLEVCVEGEAVRFGDFSALGVFDEDLEFRAGEGLEVPFQLVRGDGRGVFNVLLSVSLRLVVGVRVRDLEGEGFGVCDGVEEHKNDHCVSTDIQVVFSGFKGSSNIHVSLKLVRYLWLCLPCHHANSTVAPDVAQDKTV